MSEALTFNPRQINTCQLWLDGADPNGNGVLPANNSAIATWTDKSGSGNNLSQATAGNRPLFTKVNTMNMINFVRANANYLINTSFSKAYSNCTIFIVFQRGTIPDNARIFVALNSAYTDDWNSTAGFSLNGGLELASAGSGTSASDSPNLNLTMYSISINNNSANLYKNGSTTALLTRSMGITGNSIGIVLGAGTASGSVRTSQEVYNGYMAEIIIFQNALSLTQQQRIEGYLAWKWGLTTNLPSSHPHKGNPPFSLAISLPLPPPIFGNFARAFFRPTQIAGCQLWFDGTDPNANGIQVANNTNISIWRDKSGNGRNASNVTGTPVSSNIGSRQGIYFNGTSYITGAFSHTSNTLSWFVVGTMDSDGDAYGRLLSFGVSSQYDFDNTLRLNALSRENLTAEIITYRNGFIARNMFITYSSPFMYSSILDGASNSPFLNGTAGNGAATSGNFGFDTFGLSASLGTNIQRNKGFIYEVIVYSGALTTSQRQQVEGYLAWKWGLTSPLSNGHPYKSISPINLTAPLNFVIPVFQGTKSSFFSPLNITGCQLWLDAADTNAGGTTPKPGISLATWKDKSAGGITFTASATNPIISQTAYNNLYPVQFNGSSSILSNSSFSFSIQTRTMFIVCGELSAGANTGYLSFAVSGTDYQQLNAIAVESGSKGVNQYFQVVMNNQAANTGNGQKTPFSIFGDTFSGGNEILYMNGTVVNTKTFSGTFTNSTGLILGARMVSNTISNYLNGIIAEVLLFNSVLSAQQRQNIEGYLAWKWGLQSQLPSTHPWVRFPPPPLS